MEEKGGGKVKEQSQNSVNTKEDKEIVLPENPEQCEELANVNEDKEDVWQQLEKEAADAVARAAAAVSGEEEVSCDFLTPSSDLVADRLPVEKTILIIAKASEAVLGENNEHAINGCKEPSQLLMKIGGWSLWRET